MAKDSRKYRRGDRRHRATSRLAREQARSRDTASSPRDDGRARPSEVAASGRTGTANDQSRTPIRQPDAAQTKWRTVGRTLYRGVLLAAAFGFLSDSLGWTEFFREHEILHPGSPSLGILLSALCLGLACLFAAAHPVVDSAYWRTVVDLSGPAIFALGLVLYAATNVNRTNVAPENPVQSPVSQEQSAPYAPAVEAPDSREALDLTDVIPELKVSDVLEMPDASDVDHSGIMGNVVVAEPGQEVQHPIVVKNKGERWWRARELCRERDEDFRAVVSASQCITLPLMAPGATMEVTLKFTAPLRPDTYTARWKLVDHGGAKLFPDADPVTLHVIVR